MHIFSAHFLSKVKFFLLLPQGLSARKLRCLPKQALRLYCPAKATLHLALSPSSSGVKTRKGKTQLFTLLPRLISILCPSLLHLSSSKHPKIPQFPSNCILNHLLASNLYLFADDSMLSVTPSVHSTIWRKEKTGLRYWGSSWSSKGTQRIQCPHFQFERGDFSLQINNVGKEDGGVYFCRVEQGGHVTQNVVTLRIIAGKKHTAGCFDCLCLDRGFLDCAKTTP